MAPNFDEQFTEVLYKWQWNRSIDFLVMTIEHSEWWLLDDDDNWALEIAHFDYNRHQVMIMVNR